MANAISNQFNHDITIMNDRSSSQQQQNQSNNIFSTIQHESTAYIEIDDSSDSSQPNEINQNESTSMTSIALQKEDVEGEIRKRMKKHEEFWIWDFFKLIEISSEGEKEWELSNIFAPPLPSKAKPLYKNEFKRELENNQKQWMFECKECKERFLFYASSKYSPKAYEHYENVHKQQNDTNVPPAKRKYGTVIKGDEYTNKCNSLVAATLITAKLPYNFVENEEFRLLVEHLQVGNKNEYIVPSKKSFSEIIIPQMTEKVIETIKEDISDVKGVMATLDGWTTRIENDPFISFTLHYVKNYEMKKRVLKMSDLYQSHKSDDIKDFIETTIKEFGLQKYCPMVIMTDNAPNVMKAVKDSGNIAIGCACHRIQNAIKKTLSESELFKFLVDKCNRISNSFKRNGEWNKLLKEVQLEIYEQVMKPKSNVNTRWFSNIDVMKRMMQIKETAEGVVEALSLQLDESVRSNFIKDNTFDKYEIEVIEFILYIMDKLQKMSVLMSSDTFPSLSLLIPE
ncbi:MAG: hypothetical protein IKA36_02355 [Clostridia bacterium]|nr:hypothetical protein [Clostridia bacterium]